MFLGNPNPFGTLQNKSAFSITYHLPLMRTGVKYLILKINVAHDHLLWSGRAESETSIEHELVALLTLAVNPVLLSHSSSGDADIMFSNQGIQPVTVVFNNAKNCFLHLPSRLISHLSLNEVGELLASCSAVSVLQDISVEVESWLNKQCSSKQYVIDSSVTCVCFVCVCMCVVRFLCF